MTTPATEIKKVNVLYTAEAEVTGGRKGHGRSTDGRLEVDLSTPAGLSGDGGPGTNPEQLFAIGYAACFQSAMQGVARRLGLNVDDSKITSRVGVGQIGGGKFGLEVELQISMPSVPDRVKAEELVAKADAVCPYSNAIRGNVAVTLTIL